MTITVDITLELEVELARQAAAHGRAIEAYAAHMLEEAVHPPARNATNTEEEEGEGPKTLVEVCAMVRGLTDDLDFSRNPDTGRPADLS
jgi:adenylosuccinate lyase